MNWISSVFAAAGLVLAPFGSAPSLLKAQNPWRGFDSQDPALWVVRVQRMESGSCQSWMEGLLKESMGSGVSFAHRKGPLEFWDAWEAWGPWNEDSQRDIHDCTGFPCSVKLSRSEVSQMAAADSGSRFKQYLNLVTERSQHYEVTQERLEYEFPGSPVDPWAALEKRGFISSLHRSGGPHLWVRKLDFASGEIKPMRQIVDWQVARGPLTATSWIRDAYTDHYFDSWGEWAHISCETPTGGILVIQALVLELDLLKKSDLLSRIMRGKMRDAIEKNGILYLDRIFNRMKK